MLIVKQKLNFSAFKRFYKKMAWIKTSRKLSDTKVDDFYIGRYEDKEMDIKVSIRPSMRMAVSESFKNMTPTGEKPAKDYKGKLCEFGTTIEVIIDDKFLDKIAKEVKSDLTGETQRISWK